MANREVVLELQELAAKNDGRITADGVVKAAKAKGTALHAYFQAQGAWDEKTAMQRYQVLIARHLIRSVRVVVHTEQITVKAPYFIRDPEAKPAQGYSTLSRLRSDADVAREAVINEFVRASAALARAKNIAAALNLSDEIEALQSEIDAFRNDLDSNGEEHRPAN